MSQGLADPDTVPLWRHRTAVGERLLEHVVASPKADRHVTVSPIDARPLFAVPCSTEEDVDLAFASARRAQATWATTSMRERRAIMLRFHDLVLQRRNDGLDICQWETGKARKDALEELLDIAITARHYAKVSARLLEPERVASGMPLMIGAKVVRHPKGVVGILGPWNYPLTLAVSDAIPALLAGNAVVLKPDWQTTATAMWAVELLYRAGLPNGLLRVVAGDGPIVGPMVVERADFVMFTGSTRVGREVASAAGRRLVGCSLELGGKNAMLVCDDADPDKAAEIAVRAAFSNAGQLCISMERILVAEGILEPFLAAFRARAEALVLSAQPGWGADMGSLISESQLARVRGHVDQAVATGATVVSGGRHRPDLGPYVFEPTILTGVTDDMAVCREETFGPVASVYPFSSDDQAVRMANDTSFGLNGAVLSSDPTRAQAIALRLKVGSVNINEAYGAAWASLAAPMGGVGDSGLGRRHGAEGLLKYTEPQAIATQRFGSVGPQFGRTHEEWSHVMVRAVQIMKRVGLK